MLKISLVLQDASTGRVSAVIGQLAELGSSARFRRLRVAVAYASYSGCRDLVRDFEKRVEGWRRLHKRWLVSIDFGRTEAEALEYLESLPSSEVRIPEGMELLDHSLIPQRCFHPKTFILDSGADLADRPFAVFVGSGNLTLSGLHTGVEHGTSLLWLPPLRRREAAILRRIQSQLAWWDEAWRNADPLTAELLTRYRRSRPSRPKEDTAHSVRSYVSSGRREVDTVPGLAWAHSRCFWIQTQQLYKNRGENRSGNQLDLRRGTRVYFGFPPNAVPRNTVLGSIKLQYDAMPHRARSVRFGDNSMDKVNLPIPDEDGPASYDNSVVHFERIGRKRFRVSLGNGQDLDLWRAKSQKQGMGYKMAGGREFGFYN